MSLRIRRGLDSERSGQTFDQGEIVWTTNTQQLWVGDGATQGGISITKKIAADIAGTGLIYNPTSGRIDYEGVSLTTDDIAEGSTIGKQYFTPARAEAAINAAFIAGSTGGLGGTPLGNVVFSYDDTLHLMYATVTPDGVGITQVYDDTSPSLGGNLDVNSHTVNGTGDITLIGDIDMTGGITATGIVNSDTGFTGNITGDVLTATGTAILDHTSQLLTLSTTLQFANLNFLQTEHIPYFNINGSRGTFATPTVTVSGDSLSGIALASYTGTQYDASVVIGGVADGNVINSLVPGKFQVEVVNAAGDDVELLTFSSAGVLKAPILSVGDGTAVHPSIVFTTDGSIDTGFYHPADGVVCVSTNGVEKARFDNGGLRVSGFMKVADVAGTLPSPAEAGMIVLDGTTFKGYNGSAWVVLG